ncbi:MAG: transposase [Candidatus Zixiibacteriota bacterium]
MRNDPPRNLRLPHFDYSTPGTYFVTVCTAGRRRQLADPRIASIVTNCWAAVETHREKVTCDEVVIMPEHLHGILLIAEDPGSTMRPRVRTSEGTAQRRMFGPQKARSLPVIVGGFKSACTRLVGQAGLGPLVWQRRYYEHVIRNEADLARIRQYIRNNSLELTPEFFEKLSPPA